MYFLYIFDVGNVYKVACLPFYYVDEIIIFYSIIYENGDYLTIEY